MGWIKQQWPNIALLSMSIVIALFFVEIVLRHTLFAGLLQSRGEPEGYYRAANAGYDIVPDLSTTTHHFADGNYDVWSNNIGCFDTPYHKQIPYAIIVGDSFAWGYTPFEDKWGTLLQKYLSKNILKCGVSGYGTAQEYLKTEKILSQVAKPHLLIVAYFANDVGDDSSFLVTDYSRLSTSTTAEQTKILERNSELLKKYCVASIPSHPLFQQIKCFLRRQSVLYLLIQNAVKDAAPPGLLTKLGIAAKESPQPIPGASEIRAHLHNILKFKNLTDKEGIQLLFVMIPTKEAVASSATTTLQYTPIQNSLEANTITPYLERHGIDYIDPLPDLRIVARSTSTPLFWRFDGHFNPTGNHLLALLVARHIMQQNRDSWPDLQLVEDSLAQEFSLEI